MNERIPQTVVMDPVNPTSQAVRQETETAQTYIVPKKNGGTGTDTPGLVAGTGVTISGDWPNQKIDVAGTVGGSGDMTKAVYDPNGDGKVLSADSADVAPWAGISGKPTTFTPSTHTHSAADLTSGTIPSLRFGISSIPISAITGPLTPPKGGTGLSALGSALQILRTNATADGMEWATMSGGGDMLKANNLSDLTNAATARTNLGLGSLATQSGTFSGTSSGTNTGDQTSVTGNAGTATALQTARTINGVSFNGTANIVVPAAGSTLTDTVPPTKGGTGLTALGSALQVLRTNAAGTAAEWATPTGGGGGDASTNTTTSVDGEVALFSGTGGKTLKRASATGNARLVAGVLGTGPVDLATETSGILPVANGGTGTSTPGLIAGSGVSVSGSWPNQTISASGGGGTAPLRMAYTIPKSQAAGGTAALALVGGTATGVSQAASLTTGTDTNGRARVWWNSTANQLNAGAQEAIYRDTFTKCQDSFVIFLPVAPTSTENYLLEVGLIVTNSTTAQSRDGVFVRISSAGVQGVMRSNDTETVVTCGTAFADGGKHKFLISYTPSTGAAFSMDGTVFGTIATNEPSITTPLQVGASMLKTAGTTSRSAHIGSRVAAFDV